MNSFYQYVYTVRNEPFEEGRIITSTWDEEDKDWIAEGCASDHHRNHDGWESSWPITVSIFRTNGTKIGTFEVDRDVEPVFSAREVK